MHQILAYIKFLIRSTNQHGVHSPFVFGLVTKCFYDKKKYPAYQLIKNYRKKLLSNHDSIKVTDFGAGSKIFKSEERKVSKIAKTAGISPKRARLLNRLVRYLQVETALELGTSVGIGTAALAAGNKVQITTIEGCPETAAVAKKQFDRFDFTGIDLKVEEFQEFLEKSKIRDSEFKIKNSSSTYEKEQATGNRKLETGNRKLETEIKEYDLIFIDGNHRKEPTLTYFDKLLPLVHNDSVMIFDDIHWSKEMEEAWDEIKSHPSVRVTIDTFFQGFVFFRKEQAKEHFVIRV